MDITFAIKGIGGGILTTIPGGEWEDILSALLHLIDEQADFYYDARLALQLEERSLGAAELGILRVSRGGSAQTAKKRLQLVLAHDRSGLSPGKLEALKIDMIDVLSQHVEIDRRSVSLSLTKDRNQHHLVADIPLVPQRSRRRKVN